MIVPKLRFAEFSNEWITKKLDEVSKIYDGTHQTPNYKNNGIKFVSVENISNINGTDKYISIEDFNTEFKIRPQINDILMTRITAGIIGATAIVESNEPLGYYVSLALIRKNENIDVNFLNEYINSSLFKKELNKRIIHVAFPKKINLGDIGECRISTTNIMEQEKIGKFLSLLDKKIELQSKKIKALKLFKKGLSKTEYTKIKTVNLVKLRDISKIYQPQTLSQEKLDNGEYPVFGANGIIGMHSKYNHELSQITISCRGENSGVINKTPDNCWINGNSMVINIDNNDNIIKDYLKIILETQNLKYMVSGSGQPQIIRSVVEKHAIPLIDIKNQYEYCSKFIILDKIINFEQLKLNKLQELKKGLMQNMFV